MREMKMNLEKVRENPQKEYLSRLEEKRSRMQDDLLYDEMKLVYDDVLEDLFRKKGSKLNILDVGCENGYLASKVFDAKEKISMIIGIDLKKQNAEKCNKNNINCYTIDYEKKFVDKIRTVMKEKDISEFDIVNVSLVMLHLKNPLTLLKQLKEILSANGNFVVIDIDDRFVQFEPPEEEYYGMIKILEDCPSAGKRDLGLKLVDILKREGWKPIKYGVCTMLGVDDERREDVFSVYFDLVPIAIEETIKDLKDEDCEGHKKLQRHKAYFHSNYEKVKSEWKEGRVTVSYGFVWYICKPLS